MTRNELSVFTSFAYAPRDFRLGGAARVAPPEPPRLDRDRPLADGQAAFRKMAHDPGATLKLMLKP